MEYLNKVLKDENEKRNTTDILESNSTTSVPVWKWILGR